ncbi:hypothetical protein ACBJ59_19465 [Nonomuraea sp. MTCD27]|uniref:hypothetical protein n=1 Tax=Nonomuraea sp. MTCD27 TaxID=1676747 RepID=UPI0035C0CF84
MDLAPGVHRPGGPLGADADHIVAAPAHPVLAARRDLGARRPGSPATGSPWASPSAPASPPPCPASTWPGAGVAVERGPLVYCLERTDPPGFIVDDLCVASPDLRDGPRFPACPPRWSRSRPGAGPTSTGRTTTISQPHRDRTPGAGVRGPGRAHVVPYYAWANRGAGPMTVWAPMH